MIFTKTIFTKLMLTRKMFVKSSYIGTKFHENPTKSLLADTRSLTDGRMWSPNEEVLFYLVTDTSQCFRAIPQQWCEHIWFPRWKEIEY